MLTVPTQPSADGILRLMAVAAMMLAAPGLWAEQPRRADLREEVERSLVQIDVSIEGPTAALEALTAEAFHVQMMTRVVDDFVVDRLCDPSRSVASEDGATRDDPRSPAPVDSGAAVRSVGSGPTTFLFYFDHALMTPFSNNEAPRLAKELVHELIADGNRGMVVSNGRTLTTYVELTDDPQRLVAGIENMYANHTDWWGAHQADEENRTVAILDTLRRHSKMSAEAEAKKHAAEERWQTEKALHRLSVTLTQLVDQPQPKALLYFADRLRHKPGAHYLQYFSPVAGPNDNPDLVELTTGAVMAQLTVDRVLDEANALGVRVYPIHPGGMKSLGTSISANVGASHRANLSGGTRHHLDAEEAARTMAAETGGRAFVNESRPHKIAAAIREDLSCVYLVSFDGTGFPRDRPLGVKITVNHPDLEVRHRGQTVIQSDEKRLTRRLLGAFSQPTLLTSGRARGSVIPLSFDGGEYSALIQFAVDGAATPDASWDVGVSAVARGRVLEDTSQRLTIRQPGTPFVFETVMTFPPGPYEVVLVAHETSTDAIVTDRLDGKWPLLDQPRFEVGPVAILQPLNAVFLRDGASRSGGAAAVTERTPLLAERPTVIASLVCWPDPGRRSISVQRVLRGASPVSFPDLAIANPDERCATLLDEVPGGLLGEGEFVYEVGVVVGDQPTTTHSTRFFSSRGAEAH